MKLYSRLKALFVPLCLFLFLSPSLAEALPKVPTNRGTIRGGNAAPGDFMLWWNVPIRWIPNVPLTWLPSWYEVNNQRPVWTLENAPAGMVIDPNLGTVTWPNPISGSYPSIKVKATRATCNSAVYSGCSLTAEQVFTLTVGTADSLFVAATGGSDANPCSLAQPCATISHAASLITGTNGKTIWVRGGAHTESWAQGTNGLFDGQTFPLSDYSEIRSYPGEWSATNASAASGLPTSDLATGVVIDNLEIFGSTSGERGNFVIRGTDVILADFYSHDASWTGNENCTGVNLSAKNDGLVIRGVSHSNKTLLGNLSNVSNFLVYNDSVGTELEGGNAVGSKFIIDVKGWDSQRNIKIKHTNAAHSYVVIHDTEASLTTISGFGGFGNESSFRYGIVYNDPGFGIEAGITDPNFTTAGMDFEHNEVLSTAASTSNFWVQDNYGTAGSISAKCNIFHQVNGGCNAGRADAGNARKVFAGWINTATATAAAYPFVSDFNLLYNSSDSTLPGCFEIGPSGGVFNLASWKAQTGTPGNRDLHSLVGNPLYVNSGIGNLNRTSTSPAASCDASCGGFCGALRPNVVYGLVGQQNRNLIVWDDVVGGVPTPTPSPTPTPFLPTPTPTPPPIATPTPVPTGTVVPTAEPTFTPQPGICTEVCSDSGFNSHSHSYYGNTQNIVSIRIRNLCSCDGRTGLSSTSNSFYIAVRPNVSAKATVYLANAGQIQSIPTLGTFLAPSAGKIRFGEIGAGGYEIQLDKKFFSIPTERFVDVCAGGASNMASEICTKVFVTEAPQ